MDPIALVEFLYVDQNRLDGSPMTSHFYTVRDLLIEAGVKDKTTLKAAILHDVLEDTCLTKKYLALRYGKRTADIVELLSKDDQWSTGYVRMKSNLDEMEQHWLAYPEAIVIKLADRIHNLQTVKGFTKEKQARYRSDTESLLIPFFKKILKNELPPRFHKVAEYLLAKMLLQIDNQASHE